MSNYLIKTAESAVKQDKNGRNYKTISLQEVVVMKTPFGDMLKSAAQSKSRNVNCYEKSYLNEKEEIGYSAPLFDAKKPANGGIFEGSIETRVVEIYAIPDAKLPTGEREVNTYTTVVFGDTESPAYENLVQATFKGQGHQVVVAVEAADLEVKEKADMIASPVPF